MWRRSARTNGVKTTGKCWLYKVESNLNERKPMGEFARKTLLQYIFAWHAMTRSFGLGDDLVIVPHEYHQAVAVLMPSRKSSQQRFSSGPLRLSLTNGIRQLPAHPTPQKVQKSTFPRFQGLRSTYTSLTDADLPSCYYRKYQPAQCLPVSPEVV